MCLRTKTSYGCGCVFKNDDPCSSSRCGGLEKYHYIKEGDCRSCRSGGQTVTRGREGKGRYAQEIHKRDPADVSGGASPWAPTQSSSRGDQEWQSPTRQKADSAWEDEHSSRIEDLQSRLEKISVASDSPRRVASPEPIDDHYYSQESDTDRRARRHPKKLFAEVDADDDYAFTARRRRDPRPERVPTDSFESIASSTPRPHRSHPARSRSHKDDPYDSGYGSHSSYKSYDYRPTLTHSQSAGLYGYGARTEPRTYGYSLPRSRTYEVPISTTYGGYSSHLGTYGVELSPSGHARLMTSRRY